MNIWKRFLSLALVLALVLSMGPIIPFVQANAETTSTLTEKEWNFDDGSAEGLTFANGYSVSDGKLNWASGDETKANKYVKDFVYFDGSESWEEFDLEFTATISNAGGWSQTGIALFGGNVTFRLYGSGNKTIGYIAMHDSKAGSFMVSTRQVQGLPNTFENTTGSEVPVKARYFDGVLTIYVDGVLALKYDMADWQDGYYLKPENGGKVGLVSLTSSSSNTTVQNVVYDNIRVAPVYKPEADMGGEVAAWHNSAHSNGIDTGMWTTSGTYTMADNAVSAGANFKMYTNSNSYLNGYIETDITIDEGNMASLESGTKYGGNIHARWNLSVVEVRPRFQVVKKADGTYTATLQLVGYCNADTDWGSAPKFGPAYSIPDFKMGNTYKVRLTVIGNYIQVKLNGVTVSEWTLDAAEDLLASRTGYFGVSHTGDFAATYDNVIAVSVSANTVSVDDAAKSYITLSNRTHYVAGETVTLKVDVENLNPATLKVNGGAVAVSGSGDTYTFTMPEGAATVTCDPYTTYTVTAGDGITVNPNEAKEGAKVTIKIDESVMDAETLKVNGGAIAIEGADGIYTFTMPGEAVNVTCDMKQLDPVETLTTYQPTGDPVYSWSYSAKTWKDGVVEVDLQLPTISEEELDAARAVGTKGGTSNPNYAVSIKTGSYTVTGTLFLWRNSDSTQLRFDTTAGLCADASQRYTFADDLDELFYDGSLVTFRIAKVGNFIQVQLIDGEAVVAEFSYTVPDGTNFTNATEWTVSVVANKGLLYTAYDSATSTASGELTTTATIERAVVKRINKTVAINTESNQVKLPATVSAVDKTTKLARNAYFVGETIALDVTGDVIVKANGVVVADPANFVIPNAESVVITTEALPTYAVTAPAGIAVNPANAREGQTVTITLNEALWNSATLTVTGASGEVEVTGSNGTYTFVMPGEAVTITCNAPYKPETDFGGAVVAWYESANSGNEIDTDLWTINTAGYSINAETGKIVTTGAFKMNTGSAIKYRNASIKATVTLPAEAPAAATNLAVLSATVNGSQSFNLRFRNSGSTIQGGFYMYDSLTANGTAAYGGPGDGSTNASGGTQSWFAWGGTYHMEMYRIGNYICAKITDANNSENSLVQSWCLNPAYQLETTSAYFIVEAGLANVSFDNIVVTSYDDVAHEISLPAGMTADSLKEIGNGGLDSSGVQSFSRTHYAAGETVTLIIDEAVYDAATLKVNGGAVAVSGSNGTYTFVMPAEAVTVTCDEIVIYTISENLDGLSVDKTEAKAGDTVKITINENLYNTSTLKVNDGAVAVSGSNGTYTFVMPAGNVTITCEEKVINKPDAAYPGGTVVAWLNSNLDSFAEGGWTTSSDVTDLVDGVLTTKASFAASVAGKYNHATFKMDVTLPTNLAIKNQIGTIDAVVGSATVHFRIWRDSETSVPYIEYCLRSTQYGGAANNRYKIASLELGVNYTIEATKVGNLLSVTVSDGTTTTVKAFNLNPEYDVVTGSAAYSMSFTPAGVKLSNIVFTSYDSAAYTVTVPEGVEVDNAQEPSGQYSTNGKYNRTYYRAGETVTLTIDETVYDTTTLKVNGVTGVATKVSDGKYTFTMPAGDATITCDVLELPVNETLYKNNGDTALSSDLWSSAVALTNGKLTGAITSKYETAIKDGWFKVKLQMPETLPNTSNQQVVIEAVEVNSNIEIEFGLFGNAQYRAFIRSSNSNYGTSSNTTYVFPVGQTNFGTDIAGKIVTLGIRTVGNYFELSVQVGEDAPAVYGFTMTDITKADGSSVYTTIENAEFKFGLSWAAFSDMSVAGIEVGRINETVTVSVDAGSKDLVSLKTYKDPSTLIKDDPRARTAYQIGEVIALNVGPYAKNVKANGVAVADTNAFVVPGENVVLTAELDQDPYYVNTMEDITTLTTSGAFAQGNGNIQFITENGAANDGTAMIKDISSISANHYVASVKVTVYPQTAPAGTEVPAYTKYPWVGIELNGMQFRVVPNSANEYAIAVNNGSGWEANAPAALSNIVTLTGKTADNRGGIAYEIAVMVAPAAEEGKAVYTLYIDGNYAYDLTANAGLSAFGVRGAKRALKESTSATATYNNPGVEIYFDDLRIDRVGSVDEVTFGDKQLALNDDLTVDFNVALPAGTTASAAKITVGNLSKTVSLAEVRRNVMVDGRVGETGKVIGWYSWYVVTANVPVKDVNTDIVIQLVDGEGNDVGAPYTYKVKTYVDYVIANGSDAQYAPFVNVAKSLLDYGATAASYFADRNGSATLDENLATRLNEVTTESVKDFTPSRTGSADGISLYGCSLEALDKANICLYFKVSPGTVLTEADITVTFGGGNEAAEFVLEDASNGYKRVKITGIDAANLDVVYTVTVGELVIEYSGLSYVYTALNSNTSDNLKTMAKALYLYWAAAEAMN